MAKKLSTSFMTCKNRKMSFFGKFQSLILGTPFERSFRKQISKKYSVKMIFIYSTYSHRGEIVVLETIHLSSLPSSMIADTWKGWGMGGTELTEDATL